MQADNNTIPNRDLLKIDRNTFNELIICSVRYALGRTTHIVSDICNIVRTHLPEIEGQTIGCIERDIRDATDYGMDIDEQEWRRLLNELREEMKTRNVSPRL